MYNLSDRLCMFNLVNGHFRRVDSPTKGFLNQKVGSQHPDDLHPQTAPVHLCKSEQNLEKTASLIFLGGVP